MLCFLKSNSIDGVLSSICYSGHIHGDGINMYFFFHDVLLKVFLSL